MTWNEFAIATACSHTVFGNWIKVDPNSSLSVVLVGVKALERYFDKNCLANFCWSSALFRGLSGTNTVSPGKSRPASSEKFLGSLPRFFFHPKPHQPCRAATKLRTYDFITIFFVLFSCPSLEARRGFLFESILPTFPAACAPSQFWGSLAVSVYHIHKTFSEDPRANGGCYLESVPRNLWAGGRVFEIHSGEKEGNVRRGVCAREEWWLCDKLADGRVKTHILT